MRFIRKTGVVFLVVCFIGMSQFQAAQEKPMSEEEMMKKFLAYSTPGANHEYLEYFVGNWDAVNKMWPAPGAEPVIQKHKMSGKMILGGRYYQYEIEGTFQGMPFKGLNTTGFDNTKKIFISLWLDNMGTGFYMTEGTLDKSRKIRTETGKWDDIMTGGKMDVKMVYKIVDEDTFVFEMHQKAAMFGNKEFLTMEITYTRRK